MQIYAVCTDEAFAADQRAAKELIAHGFGLITVDQDGTCHVAHKCIAFTSRISLTDYHAEVANTSLPASCKREINEAFEIYQTDPVAGLSRLCELAESMIRRAGDDAKKKGMVSGRAVRAGKPAAILDAVSDAVSQLDAMTADPQLVHARAAIGDMRGYIQSARNVANHAPKDKKQAAERLRKSKLQFLEGVRKIDSFRKGMKAAGLSGGQ